jgi:hypothetical protein
MRCLKRLFEQYPLLPKTTYLTLNPESAASIMRSIRIAGFANILVTVPGVEHPMGLGHLKCSNLEDCGICHAEKSLQ